MTIWQKIEKRKKVTMKALKVCPIRSKYVRCGFKPPVVNIMGQCSGCRNPDDGELEPQCDTCSCNEYYIEEERV